MDNIVGTSPGFQKFSKFLMMGLTAITISNAMIQPQIETSPLLETQKIERIIQNSAEKGLLETNMRLKVHELEDNADRLANYYMTVKADGACEINVSVDQHGHFEYMGSKENVKDFKELTHPSNNQEAELFKELIVFHEASHCEFNKIEEPFLVKGNPKLQQNVNFAYKNTNRYNDDENGESRTYTGINLLLNETFADTYGAIQLIKSHGATPDVLKTLNQFQLQRHELGFSTRAKSGLEEHDTHFALTELLKPNNIERIVKNNNPEELKQMALEFSNISIGNVLVNTSLGKSLSVNTIVSGVMSTMNSIEKQQEILILGNNQESTELNPFINTENSLVFKMAQDVLKDIQNNKIEGYQSADKDGKHQIIFDNITDRIHASEHDVVTTSIQFRDYIKQNFQKQDLETINITTSKEEMVEKLTTIKTDFINKNSILSRMNKMRDKAFSSETSNKTNFTLS